MTARKSDVESTPSGDGQALPASAGSTWLPMEMAPTDGTEVVGWVPLKGHFLMRYRDGWEYHARIPHKQPGFFTLGWRRFGNPPTYWRHKEEDPREWIY